MKGDDVNDWYVFIIICILVGSMVYSAYFS
jgi:hypothetical protein